MHTRSFSTLSALATTTAVLAAATGGCDPQAFTLPTDTNPAPSRSAALAALPVTDEASMSGYDRDAFPHWSAQGDGCDTRDTVLAAQSDETTLQRDEDCDAETGTWISLYDNTTITDPSELDIDHLVPLAEAWRSGAHAWTDAQREAFANDTTGLQLVAVTASTNREKGDADPASWMPPHLDAHCGYVEAWVQVKHTYGLSVDPAEHRALTAAFAPCEAVHPG